MAFGAALNTSVPALILMAGGTASPLSTGSCALGGALVVGSERPGFHPSLTRRSRSVIALSQLLLAPAQDRPQIAYVSVY